MPVNSGETERRSDHLNPIEKERINTMVTSPVARLMAVTLRPDRSDILNPNKALSTQKPENAEILHELATGIQDKTRKREINYAAIEALSVDSRTDFWEKKKQEAQAQGEDLSSFAKQNEHWNNSITQWLKKNTDPTSTDTTVQERIKTLKTIHLDVTTNEFTQTQDNLNILVENFRKKYLKGGSNIKQFVEDIANGCKDNNDQAKPVNLATLKDRLKTVETLFTCFGEKATDNKGHEKDNVVNRLVKDYAITHSLLTQNREEVTSEIASKVTAKATEEITDPDEQNRLQILFDRQPDTHTPTRPSVSAHTPRAVPAPLFDRGDQATTSGQDTGQPLPDILPSADTGKDRELVADAGGTSEWGRAHGKNQDAYFFNKEKGAFGVFDGLGEAKFSHLGSDRAKKFFNDVLSYMPDDFTKSEADTYMKRAFWDISAEIYTTMHNNWEPKVAEEKAKLGRELSNHELESLMYKVGMDTTAVVAKIYERTENGKKNKKAIIAHAGDSRAYLLRKNDKGEGKLTCLTLDDTNLPFVFGEQEAKRIQDIEDRVNQALWATEYKDERTVIEATTQEKLDFLNKREWSDEKYHKLPPFYLGEKRSVRLDRLYFDHSSMTKCIGSPEPFEPTIQEVDLLPGDRLLLVTDGVYAPLKLEDMEKVLIEHPQAEEASIALIDEIIAERGAVPDDTTAVVINI